MLMTFEECKLLDKHAKRLAGRERASEHNVARERGMSKRKFKLEELNIFTFFNFIDVEVLPHRIQ
ncbi:MAG: hypothetical protein FWH34_07605 [Desulfovibrionaceae bacterium]|nr:hypothetical protein [Desulfovibrionaceae bacterium]